jgi:DNA-binding IclR family transcriptional regulator
MIPPPATHGENGTNTRIPGHVRSAWRALAVLEAVAESPLGMTLTDITAALHLPASSAHGLLSTLSEAGYLVRDADTLRYRLGPRLGKLAAAFRAQGDLVTLAKPAMDRLRAASGQTVSLTVLQDDHILFVDKRTTDGQVQIVNPVGTRLPAHATGSGKAMLAYLPEADLARLYPGVTLPQRTPHTLATREALWRALAMVRRRGWALDEQESDLGVWAVAAVIREANGLPVGALSIFVPIFRLQGTDRSMLTELVREAAADVSTALGFTPADPDRRPALGT